MSNVTVRHAVNENAQVLEIWAEDQASAFASLSCWLAENPHFTVFSLNILHDFGIGLYVVVVGNGDDEEIQTYSAFEVNTKVA